MKKLIGALLCLCVGTLCGCMATGQNDGQIILRYAEDRPEEHPKAQAALEFSRLVEQESEGRIQIRVYTGGELGDETSAALQVRLGGIDFSCVSAGILQGTAAQLEVLNMPYLFGDAQKMWELLDGETGKEYLDMLEDEGYAGLAFYNGGTQQIYSSRQIFSAQEMQTLPMLASDEGIFGKMITAVGGQPIYAAPSEALSLLTAGTADGGESDLYTYRQAELYQAAPYLLMTGHTRKLDILIASPYTMQQFSAEDRTMLLDCARRSAVYERELRAQQEEQARKELKEKGVVFTKISEDELAAFRLALQPLYSALTPEKQKAAVRIRQAV